jgi:hypothetical protein
MIEYINRYRDKFTFTKQEDGNVLWEGSFEMIRMGGEPDDVSFIDPSGGPFISKGQMLSHIIGGDDMNVIVEGFENIDNGFLIRTKENKVDPNDMSHLEDAKRIGGLSV